MATSPPNALLRASEGTRPAAAPDEVAAEVLAAEAEEVAGDVVLEIELEVAVAFVVSAAHSVC